MVEGVGCYTDQVDGQRIPPAIPNGLRWLFPRPGNSLAAVGNLRSWRLAWNVRRDFNQATAFSLFPLFAPVQLSDGIAKRLHWASVGCDLSSRRVLSGELVLNFRKTARTPKRTPKIVTRDPEQAVRECCDRTILENCGATTEELLHAVVPKLLETGLLNQFSRGFGDLTPWLEKVFDFDVGRQKWFLRSDEQTSDGVGGEALTRYYIVEYLSTACGIASWRDIGSS